MENQNSESSLPDKPKFPVVDEKIQIEKIKDTGRLYIRNLDFSVTEEDVVNLFKEYGDLVEVSVPYDSNLKRIKAFGFVTFMLPRDAVTAFKALNLQPFKGRKLQILPGQEKPEGQSCKGVLESKRDHEETGSSSFKTDKLERQKAAASSSHNWNALFVNSDVVAQFLADNMGISKSDLFQDTPGNKTESISVRLAQAESQLVSLVEQFLSENSIRIDRLESLTSRTRVSTEGTTCPSFALSSTTFVVKNLSVGIKLTELEDLFRQYSGFVRALLPPYGVTAIVTYELSQQAKIAYQNCAYMEFKDTVLMLQWAPLDLFVDSAAEMKVSVAKVTNENSPTKEVSKKRPCDSEDVKPKSKREKVDKTVAEEPVVVQEAVESVAAPADDPERSTRIVMKNISFQATQDELEQLVAPFKGVTAIRMPRKPTGGHKGFAFVEFETEDHAQKLMDTMAASTHLLGRRLVLQYSKVA